MKRLCLICIAFLLYSGVYVHGQNIPDNAFGRYLPYTYEVPMGYMGKMITTVHEDGSMTSKMVTICGVCNGRGACNVCGGTGGQYWYGMGIQPCLSCSGTGRCGGCMGDGVAVMNTMTTPNGVTVGYDEQGRAYIAYPGQSGGSGSRSSGSSSTSKCSCCDGTGKVVKDDALAFGLGTKYCNICKRDVSDTHYHSTCTCCHGKGRK